MRNPLNRQPATEPRKPLRERLEGAKARLTETGKRAGQALAVARVVMRPDPKPAPAVDRVALVNYATFLAFERDHVCRELYPHMGRACSRFLITLNAAERFFFPAGYGSGLKPVHGTEPAPASSRAVAVLDLAGVDWRQDLNESGRNHFDSCERGTKPRDTSTPHGWPRADTVLVEALDDLTRLDAALDAMHGAAVDETRSVYEAPGYAELKAARSAALARLTNESAVSLAGLRAKARALQTRDVIDDPDRQAKLVASLARDILSTTPRALDAALDPIFALIAEARRLTSEHGRLYAISGYRPDSDPSWEPTRKASDAMWEHIRGPLLNTHPTTAEGCRALAWFALGFTDEQGVPVDVENNDAVLRLIARSPLI